VVRVGGDEFTVMLPDLPGREDAESVARKIFAALAAPFQLGSQKQSVNSGTSIGIALYPSDARDADALVRAADQAHTANGKGNHGHFPDRAGFSGSSRDSCRVICLQSRFMFRREAACICGQSHF
jgi:predicted signal transduction protein with EAL and GGDEF domain